MKKVSEFVKEVKSEMTKVTWATRKETMTTTLAVFVMVFIAALFFFINRLDFFIFNKSNSIGKIDG